MKKRTRKWIFVAQEAQRLAGVGLSAREIARRLDLHASTVRRWLADGRLSRPRRKRRLGVEGRPAKTVAVQTPAEWAAAVRATYDLDATDDQLVALASAALALSLDRTAPAHVRMSGSSRFQSIVRQLALVTRGAQADSVPPPVSEPKKPTSPRLRRAGGADDPRRTLTLVHDIKV